MLRVLLVIAMVAGTARADVPSPDEEACRGQQIGDSCEGGACAMQKCSRSRPGPDGVMVTNEWDCLRCTAGAPGSEPGTWRIVIGVIVALACVGGGVWFARRRMIKL
jgi:hypothetical protein